jgi:hypothetical protein
MYECLDDERLDGLAQNARRIEKEELLQRE